MTNVLAGIVLPFVDQELSQLEAAREMCIPERTLRRWLSIWLEMGIEGVRSVECAKGRYGRTYRVSRDFIERWRRCKVPTPRRQAA